jgi:glycosyltransferase involved in cell wall biosynthesis
LPGHRRGEDLAAHYASGDLFLFPSLTETFGNVVTEAMASALPIVAFNRAAAAEHLIDGESAALPAPGDSEAFAMRAVELATDTHRRAHLAEPGLSAGPSPGLGSGGRRSRGCAGRRLRAPGRRGDRPSPIADSRQPGSSR